jgi:hypothetical protein
VQVQVVLSCFVQQKCVCKALCLIEELALCLDLFWEGGSGA